LMPTPAFDNSTDERAVLDRILVAAEISARSERKLVVLTRFLRRVHEPVVVFTEYRDTLSLINSAVGFSRRTVLLHGGLTRIERRASVDAFTSGRANLLLATDAGAEGLNLQATCRVVVNLELPWNPVRLEQRIGRVDRLGQTRTVHAIHLFAEPSAESTVLARLVHRVDRIRTEADIALEVLDAASDRFADRR
jgi:superfamily II DNA/RNA helicase